MLRRELLMTGGKRPGLGGLDETLRPVRIDLWIHVSLLTRIPPAPKAQATRSNSGQWPGGAPQLRCKEDMGLNYSDKKGQKALSLVNFGK
jgi:hypothetical protein